MNKIFLILLMGMFMLSFTSAVEWDNYYTYDDSTRTATFRNGLTLGSKIAEVRLTTPVNFHVAPGYNYIFELELSGNIDYADFVRGIYVHDKTQGYGIVNRDIDLKYFNGYETKYKPISECIKESFYEDGSSRCTEYETVGSEQYQVEVWTDLLPRDLRKNDNLTVRGYTNVEVDDKMEWYIDFFGAGKNTGHGTKGVKEWASWTADLNVGLRFWYNFEETTGTAVIDASDKLNGTLFGTITRGVPGVIDNAYEFDGANGDYIYSNYNATGSGHSFSIWINSSGYVFDRPATSFGYLADSPSAAPMSLVPNWLDNDRPAFQKSTPIIVYLQGEALVPNLWYHIVISMFANGTTLSYVNGTLTNNTFFDTQMEGALVVGALRDINSFTGLIDLFGYWNRTLTSAEAAQLYNNGLGIKFTDVFETITVTQNDPANNTITPDTNVQFNFTIEPNSVNITNWTLTTWFDNGTLKFQEVNTTINTNETVVVLHNETILDGNYIWNVEACGDGASGCDLSVNRTFSIDSLTPLLNITAPIEGFIVTEALQNITINFTIDDSGGTLDQCWLNTSLNSTPNFIVCADNVTSALYPVSAPDNVTLFLSANDTAGNLGTTNVTVFKNTVAPIVNITAPVEGFNVTQFNQSINLNWTNDNVTLDSCYYRFLDNGVTVSDDKFTTNASITDAGFFNYSTNTFLPGVSGLGDISFEKSLPSGNISLFSLSVTTAIGWSTLSDNADCLNQTFTDKPFVNLAGHEGEYFCVLLSDDTITINKIIGTQAAQANFTWTNYSTTLVDVNCADNTTIINYPTDNPDTLGIAFFSNDTFGNLGFDNVTIFRSQVAPSINITSPIDDFLTLVDGQSIDLNFTVTNSTTLDVCILEYNFTNTTLACSIDVQTSFTYISGVNTLTLFVNDTLANSNSTTKSWTVKVIEVNQTFNANTTEGNTESFSANIILDSGLSIAVAALVYNGTASVGTSSIEGNNTILNVDDVIIPGVTATTNLTFFWALLLSDSTQINLSTQTQQVFILDIDNCSSFTNVILNFTNVDEEFQTLLANSTIETAVNIFASDGTTLVVNISEAFTSNPTSICLSDPLTNDSSYILNVIVKYFADDYSIEYFNIVNSELTLGGTDRNITLFDLNLSDATEFQLTFTGSDFIAIESVLVFVERQYIAENVFKTVELPLTDSNGQTVLHLVRNDIIYNIIFVKDGVTLGTFENIIAFCQDFTIGNCVLDLSAINNDSAFESYEEFVGISYTSAPTYNSTTNLVTFSFISEDGSTQTVGMSVERRDIFGNQTVCTNTIASTSGTLFCDIGLNLTETVLFTIITVSGNDLVFNTVVIDDSSFGDIGYAMWFILTLFLILMASESKNGIIMVTVVSYMGALSMGWFVGGAIGIGSSGIWILVISIAAIWQINKERRS